jgi:hypothetical protein
MIWMIGEIALTMLISKVTSVLMGSSHQTQGGKSGVNPALSRNCKEVMSDEF